MPRPPNKAELIAASADRYAVLNATIEEFTPAQRHEEFPFEHRDKNVRDVLAHLHEWHLMMMRWYETGMAGGNPDMPAKGYTWKTTPGLNETIHAKYQRISLKRIRTKLASSHDALLDVVNTHTDDELFTKRRYPWTGSTSLGSYLTSAMPSHYDWAIKLLRRFLRALQEAAKS